jgi:hypothetical protein
MIVAYLRHLPGESHDRSKNQKNLSGRTATVSTFKSDTYEVGLQGDALC